MSSTGGVGLHQKLLEIERKLRDFNLLDLNKKKDRQPPKLLLVSQPGCMTSPLPRRPLRKEILYLYKIINKTIDFNS